MAAPGWGVPPPLDPRTFSSRTIGGLTAELDIMSSLAQQHKLPANPDESLRLGLRIIEASYEEKTRHLDHELQQLRAYSKQQQSQIASFERRVADLEQQVRDGDERYRALADEKAQLAQELSATKRDLSKADAFKRSILSSIQAEDSAAVSAGGPFLGGGADYTPAPPSMLTSAPPRYATPAPPAYEAAAPLGGLSSVPAGLPAGGVGTSGAFGAPSPAAAATPAITAGGVEPPNAAAVMDGKDFFRQARLRLTYEQFNQFLSNIKRLNDHAQTRDETLARAQEIFGAENSDLFGSFTSLLSKHGLT